MTYLIITYFTLLLLVMILVVASMENAIELKEHDEDDN